MMLSNGVQVRLGRREIDQRTELFLGVVADLITGRSKDIDYVDMRYSNGFTIGWKDGGNTPIENPEQVDQEMLASRGTP